MNRHHSLHDTSDFNACPREQPCDNNCEDCDYFHTGELVAIVAATYTGYFGIINRLLSEEGLNTCYLVDICDEHRNIKITERAKLASTLRKHPMENDIEYYTQK